jgi:New glue family protein
MAEPEPVPVRDLEVADRIAKAVRGGKPADRTPTIEQLVAAFGEGEPTLEARRRAARALALAGVAAVPDVLEVAPGQRLTLEVRHVRKRGALVAGVLALVLLFAAVAAAATQLDFSDDNAASSLPAESTATGPTTATNTVTQEPTSTDTTSTGTTATATTAAPTTSTAVPATASARRRAKRQRQRRAREKAARARRAKAKAAARRRVTARLNASAATFLCVEGDGKQLFNGTLTGARTFRARVLRLNIGLGPSTRLTANGKVVPLTASPTGLELTPKTRKFLPLGQRPCA